MQPYSDDLRKEARSIAEGGKNARQAWTELQRWASKRGPAAAKCAMMEFLSAYGGTSEAAIVMPQIMRNASQVFSPSERSEPIQHAVPGPKISDMRRQVTPMAPKPSLPVASTRPSLSLAFRPSAPQGPSPSLGEGSAANVGEPGVTFRPLEGASVYSAGVWRVGTGGNVGGFELSRSKVFAKDYLAILGVQSDSFKREGMSGYDQGTRIWAGLEAKLTKNIALSGRIEDTISTEISKDVRARLALNVSF